MKMVRGHTLFLPDRASLPNSIFKNVRTVRSCPTKRANLSRWLTNMKTNSDIYPAEVFWSDEDEGFIARANDLPGCSAWGKTQADALAYLSDAIEAWIGAARRAGNPVPPPSDPAEANRYSGKFLVRLPKSLHAELARKAQQENISLNQYVVYLLTKREATSSPMTFEYGYMAYGEICKQSPIDVLFFGQRDKLGWRQIEEHNTTYLINTYSYSQENSSYKVVSFN